MRGTHRALRIALAGVAIGLAGSVASGRLPSTGGAETRAATTQATGAAGARSPAERLRARRLVEGSADRAVQGGSRTAASSSDRPARTTEAPRTAEAWSRRDERAAPDAPNAEGRGDPSLRWPVLDPVEANAGTLTARVAGHDPVGDRAVFLWRRAPEGPVRLASGRSDADGAFDFGEIPVPNDGEALVVTAGATDPLLPAARLVAPARLPAPAFVASVDEGAVSVAFHPAVLAGELIVLDDRGGIAARLDAATGAGWTLRGEARERDHHVVHVLPDGRSSAPALVYEAPGDEGLR